MQDKYLLETFVKGYEQHLDPRDGAIDTVLKGSSLYNLFLWGYHLAERHANSNTDDIEYCLTEYAEELEGFALSMIDVLDWDIKGERNISSSQLRHFANSSQRLAKELFSYIEEISQKKEPTQSDQE